MSAPPQHSTRRPRGPKGSQAHKAREQGLADDHHEKLVQEAVEGIQRGEYSSSRDAAEKLGIPGAYTTIWRRLKGRALPRKKAFVKYQLLNPQQEEVLKKWVQFLALSGRPLCKRTIAPKIQDLCGKVPSRRYVYRWLRRHPDLTLGRAIGLDTKRARCFNYQTVQHHFNLLQREINEKDIPIQNIYNFDEIGIQLGGGRTISGELHFFDTHGKAPRYKVNSDSLELVTILESVCADGSAPIGPAIVLPGVKMHEEWFTDDDREYLVCTTDNGWTDDEVCKNWFTKCFIPHAQAHSDTSKPILLLYDGHSSHSTHDIIEAALANNIILFCLPPHTTHRLQPCDVGAFSPLKRAWSSRCNIVFEETHQPLGLKDVVREYFCARDASFKTDTIKSAWTKSGIGVDETTGRPVCNPGLFTYTDFAPSMLSSTQLHVPDGFPADQLGNTIKNEIQDDSASSSEGGEDDDGSDSDSDFDDSRLDPGLPRASAPPGSPLSRSASSSSQASLWSNFSMPPGPLRTTYLDPASSDLDASESDDDTDSESALRKWKRKMQQYKDQRDQARMDRNTAAAHAVLAARELKGVTAQLNAKKQARSRRTIHITSRIVTNEEGRAEAQRQKTAREEKARKENENKEKRKDEEAAVRLRRLQVGRDGMVFASTLSSQKVPGLCDIAWSLSLPETGTKDELITRIKSYFELHPHLRTTPRFIALFEGKRGLKRLAAGELENPPPASRPRLLDRTNMTNL
ncbi:hypothetical protein EUX98_g9594 [Antrodiella citrinella]|uniref:DDE-1 domain-containing protein n=1 Tax=Antrodiella citrinella TaxID=2447956 RepID=A0A4S4LW60_9APHY|nr:hypothetical protein EUX98_g9594 [Antrodiella citrinella]